MALPSRRFCEPERKFSRMLKGGALLLSSVLACCCTAVAELQLSHQQMQKQQQQQQQRVFSLTSVSDVIVPRRQSPAYAHMWENHRVLRLFLQEEKQVQKLVTLMEKDDGIDAWSPLRVGPVDFRFSPRSYNESIPQLVAEAIKTETSVDNLRMLVDEERRILGSMRNITWEEVIAAFRSEASGMCMVDEMDGLSDSDCSDALSRTASHRKKNARKGRKARQGKNANPFFDAYREYPAISKYLDTLATEYPTLVTAFSIGTSFENNTIGAVRISSTKYTARVGDKFGAWSYEGHGADLQGEGKSNGAATETLNAFEVSHVRRGSHHHLRKSKGRKAYSRFVGRKGKNEDKFGDKRHIVIAAGQHGREWIAPAVALYIATELTTKYGHEKWATRLLDAFDWTVIPVVNPDGYQYTHTSDRMWRKNREPTPDPLCTGVDTNRNWDFRWANNVGSHNPCSDGYVGPKPFSSRESQALADYITKTAPVSAFIDLHAYSMSWMSPFGGDCSIWPSDNEDILECAQGAVKALNKVHKRQFRVGSVCEVTYKTSGLSIDWAYAVGGVKYSYSVDLRDKGKYGFFLPSDQIVPSGEETYTAVLATARFILKREGLTPIW